MRCLKDVKKSAGLTGISGRMWMAVVKVVCLDEVAKWFNGVLKGEE